MADLLDIAPATAVTVVKFDDQRVTVRGVRLDGIASLVSRFPDLKSLVNDGGDSGDIVTRLIAGCGQAAAPIIAAGCDRLGDEKYEKHAAMLPPEYQLKLLGAIFALTFPNGIGSFVEALTSLLNPAGDERAKPKFVKLRWKKSPSTPSPSADTPDSLPIMQ
jgi:hypothetical protein